MGKADLHIHSYYSPDAFSSPAAILKRAKDIGLNVIAITDHDTIEGAKITQKIAPEFGIEVILGEEITTKEGDLIALFIQERIKPKKPILETIREIHQQGGLAIAPHPGNWLNNGISFETLFKIFENLDGLELLNGGWFGWLGQMEAKKFNESTFNLAVVGGSDSHLAREVGCAYTQFQGKTGADLYASIKSKLTKPSGNYWSYKGRFLWLINYPRIFYKSPRMLFFSLNEVYKKLFLASFKSK
jgi:predicted metal-dependent phosphoesterase TrpH